MKMINTAAALAALAALSACASVPRDLSEEARERRVEDQLRDRRDSAPLPTWPGGDPQP